MGKGFILRSAARLGDENSLMLPWRFGGERVEKGQSRRGDDGDKTAATASRRA